MQLPLLRHREAHGVRPGEVASIVGVIFQSDARSAIGQWIIHPLEGFDRWLAGIRPQPWCPALAIHAGLHVRLRDGRAFVVEQLVGSLYMNLVSGLTWTPIEEFRARDRGGWDVTVPATCFRGVDAHLEQSALERLNRFQGRPFFREDCTTLVERVFGGHRMFADSPALRLLGIGVRLGDPALPLLARDAHLEPRAELLLRASALRNLPDPLAPADSPSSHRMQRAGLAIATLITVVVLLRYLIGHRP